MVIHTSTQVKNNPEEFRLKIHKGYVVFAYVFPVLVGDLHAHTHYPEGLLRSALDGHKWSKSGLRTDPRGSIKVGGAKSQMLLGFMQKHCRQGSYDHR